MLVNSLAETRATLVEELNGERLGFDNFVGETREELVAFINTCVESLRAAGDAAR